MSLARIAVMQALAFALPSLAFGVPPIAAKPTAELDMDFAESRRGRYRNVNHEEAARRFAWLKCARRKANRVASRSRAKNRGGR